MPATLEGAVVLLITMFGQVQANGVGRTRIAFEVLKIFGRIAAKALMTDVLAAGAPMHAGANGTYHLGFGRYGTLNPEHAASHWRIHTSEVMPLRKRLTDGAIGFRDRDRNGKVIVRPALNKAELGRVLDEMRPRWRAEAEAAIALLDKLAAKGA